MGHKSNHIMVNKRYNNVWNDDKVDTLIRLRDAGSQMPYIADTIDISPTKIREKLGELGRLNRRGAWSREQNNRLKLLLNEGTRIADIAREFKVSSSAIIGKMQRLGLSKKISRPLSAPRATIEISPEDKQIDIEDACQYPFGDPYDKDFRYCGKLAVKGKAYCQAHCDIAYRLPNEPWEKTDGADLPPRKKSSTPKINPDKELSHLDEEFDNDDNLHL